eukprot:598858-Pyramimonas_sp.AAC.1
MALSQNGYGLLLLCSAVILRVLPCSCLFCRAPVCSEYYDVHLRVLPCSCVVCRVPVYYVCSAALFVLMCVDLREAPPKAAAANNTWDKGASDPTQRPAGQAGAQPCV